MGYLKPSCITLLSAFSNRSITFLQKALTRRKQEVPYPGSVYTRSVSCQCTHLAQRDTLKECQLIARCCAIICCLASLLFYRIPRGQILSASAKQMQGCLCWRRVTVSS